MIGHTRGKKKSTLPSKTGCRRTGSRLRFNQECIKLSIQPEAGSSIEARSNTIRLRFVQLGHWHLGLLPERQSRRSLGKSGIGGLHARPTILRRRKLALGWETLSGKPSTNVQLPEPPSLGSLGAASQPLCRFEMVRLGDVEGEGSGRLLREACKAEWWLGAELKANRRTTTCPKGQSQAKGQRERKRENSAGRRVEGEQGAGGVDRGNFDPKQVLSMSPRSPG